MMKTIGITGGIGAGKSTVLTYLREDFCARVLQADQVGHLLMEPGEPCYEPVLRAFGQGILDEKGQIDRRVLGSRVFKDPEGLRTLNGIIHPAVEDYILKKREEARQEDLKVFVVEAALLFEASYERFCDTVWVVRADPAIRIERLIKSRGYSPERCRDVMANQKGEGFYASRADAVIDNSGDEDATRQVIHRLMEELLRKG